MSLLSKKIALSVTPAGPSLSREAMEAFLAEPLAAALSRWTGRSSWSLTCNDVGLKLAIDAFDDTNKTEACLIETDDQFWLMHLDVPDGLEKLATANALGVAPSDISEALDAFSKIHSRAFAETLIENIVTSDLEAGALTRWISPKGTKLHCVKTPDAWLCNSVWTVNDATEEKEYTLTINVDGRMLPDVADDGQDDKTSPDLDVLEERLGPCRLPVRIVGGKVTLSIADCMKLEIGQVFGLPEIDFNAVDMKMPASDDILVKATLGTHFGTKAVRLSSAVDDDFLVRYASEIEPA